MIPRPDRAKLLRRSWAYFHRHRAETLNLLLAEIAGRPLKVGELPRSAELDCAALAVSYLITLNAYATCDGQRTRDYGIALLRLEQTLWRPAPELWLDLKLRSWRAEAASYPGPYLGLGDSLVRMAEVTVAVMEEWDGPVVRVCRGAAELALRRMAEAKRNLRIVREVAA